MAEVDVEQSEDTHFLGHLTSVLSIGFTNSLTETVIKVVLPLSD